MLWLMSGLIRLYRFQLLMTSEILHIFGLSIVLILFSENIFWNDYCCWVVPVDEAHAKRDTQEVTRNDFQVLAFFVFDEEFYSQTKEE